MTRVYRHAHLQSIDHMHTLELLLHIIKMLTNLLNTWRINKMKIEYKCKLVLQTPKLGMLKYFISSFIPAVVPPVPGKY